MLPAVHGAVIAVSWETELYSLYKSELRNVLREVCNAMVIDDTLHLPLKLSTFIDRVHAKFDRRADYKYISEMCFHAFLENGYQTYSKNIGIGYSSEYVLPAEAVHTTEYADTVVRFMTIHLQNILDR